ncbi:MAG: hypothetical protein AB7P02_11575 [Alphaproteobacteria bacterium]
MALTVIGIGGIRDDLTGWGKFFDMIGVSPWAAIWLAPLPFAWMLFREWRRQTAKTAQWVPPSDYATWARVDPMPLNKAAWLWCEKHPQLDVVMPPDVAAVFSMLKAAAARGELPFENEAGDRSIHGWSLVRMAALRSWAASIGKRPKFLDAYPS